MAITESMRELVQQVGQLIESHSEVLIFGHKDADGDTLGCSLAFAEALRTAGKTVWVVIPPPLPQLYAWLPGFDRIVERPPAGAEAPLVMFFDAGNMERSGDAVHHIASHAVIVNVDHHLSNTRFGDINIIDPDASAAGEMVIDILEQCGFAITPTMAANLYTAVLTDTGGFRHENTTERCLQTAAKLAHLGADPGRIATMVYKSRPLTTLRLSGLSIATMKVARQGRLAWAMVTRAMLKEAGAVMAESESIIDTLNSVAGLEMAIIFKEVTSSVTKISVRSRGIVDAAAFCAALGGGGHLRAAGAEIARPMTEAMEIVLATAEEALASSGL